MDNENQNEKKDKSQKNVTTSQKLNNFLLIFESALIVGLAQLFLEDYISELEIDIYLKVAIVMLMAGGLFSIAFTVLQSIVKAAIGIFTKLKMILSILVHLAAFAALYYLYSLLYFGVKVVEVN